MIIVFEDYDMYMDYQPLMGLIIAHIFGDFILQNGSWIEERNKNNFRSKWLYFHAFITGLLSSMVIAYFSFGLFYIAITFIVIGISHIVQDGLKSQREDNYFYFTLDQSVHFIIIVIIWSLLYPVGLQNALNYFLELSLDKGFLIIVLVYAGAWWPAGKLVGKYTEKWREEINASEGLEKAGQSIGRLERFLVLTFVILGHFEAIGFLVAAKSVFRFGEIKENRKEAEYILIGTMFSFSIAIVLGLFVNYALKFC